MKCLLKKVFDAFITFICCGHLLLFAACGESTTMSSSDNAVIDFFAIVSDLTGKEVSVDNVPYYFTIGSDNSYCTIDTNPYNIDDFSSSTAMEYIEEMNKKLGLPEYVYQEMITTSYSQGKQTETFGNITVTWYYHPDKGLNATYKVEIGSR